MWLVCDKGGGVMGKTKQEEEEEEEEERRKWVWGQQERWSMHCPGFGKTNLIWIPCSVSNRASTVFHSVIHSTLK